MDYLGSDGAIALFTLAFILGDYITGVAKALHAKQLSSSVMREGLWHKGGEIAAMALAYGVQAGCSFEIFPESFSVVFSGLCIYIIVTEGISVFENICEVSPDLKNSPLGNLLALKEKGNDEGED